MPVRFLLPTIILLCALTVMPSGQTRSGEPRLPAPGGTLSPDEALIRNAHTLVESGRFREGAAAWQTVATTQPVLSALARREAARAFVAGGDLSAARQTLEQSGTTAPADLLLAAAHAHRDAGALEEAAALYRRVRVAGGRSRESDEAGLALAALLEQQNRHAEALALHREVQQTFRQASAFDIANRHAERLAARLGAPPLTESQYEAAITRLASVAAFRQAVDMADEWLERYPQTPAATRVRARSVDHLYSLRANDEARNRARRFLERHGDAPEAHDVVITLFRLDVREARTEDVEKRGRAILDGAVAGTALSDRQGAGRLLAEYLVSIGEVRKGRSVYRDLLALTKVRRSRIDVLWRTAIAALLDNDHAAALAHLGEALALKPDSETERAITFWLGYARHEAGASTAARTQWQALARAQPFTYYGLRAAARLPKPVHVPPLTFPVLQVGAPAMNHPDYRAASALSKAGLTQEASAFARRLSAAFRRDPAVALLAARAAEAAGDYTAASTLMASHFGAYLQQPANNLPGDFWSLAYPRAYRAEISDAAGRHKVDPLLMLGIARQESHFNRAARSPVGAIGLFQVMPYTAEELDPAFASPSSMERLTEPAVSAELAAKLLGQLQNRYDGALAPTIAAYNADKHRVDAWWKAAKGRPEELFVDSIPYQQTRAYVRQVLTNYEMYRRSAQSTSR